MDDGLVNGTFVATITVKVNDAAALMRCAVAELQRLEPGTSEEAALAYFDGMTGRAVSFLLDPGSLKFEGMEVLDSTAECIA